MWVPYPSWLSPGDNAWQMTAATLVGLMSVPGLVVLYGGVMQKRWSHQQHDAHVRRLRARARRLGAVGVQDGLRHALASAQRHTGSSGTSSVYRGRSLGQGRCRAKATIPLATTGPGFRFPQATLAYFQFVFAGITPILMLGSVLGPDQLQGVDSIRRAVDLDRLHRRRVLHLGRRLLRPARRASTTPVVT